MVIGRLTGYLALGLVGAFLLNALLRPGSAAGTGSALQATGSGIASIGMGIGESLRSIGSGSAKLLDPLFSLKDLVFDSNIAGAANISAVAQNTGDTNVVRGTITPTSPTITWSGGTTSTTPTSNPVSSGGYVGAVGVRSYLQ